ncbi:serine/threonine protein kinase, CMGC, CDC2/CDK sub [Coniosporium tulheliwenetii]|uniref:Serine/threonine protein kinase, CMGC, CDC2/CDK sub n=1 Tax=Coniosporium tulheliwenetii TaxID=3383036 RepID=A0ACC2Z5H2_9PEZI|nr:serine/threonine protein kinase, CMGC, CDC2/CDK sub [Cladosporium sp. JES 115]
MATAAVASPANGLQRTFHGCSSIREYDVQRKLGEGTFGEVHKARSRRTGAVVALKKILMHNEKDGFPITALREIKLLKMLSHVNVLRLEEMAVERNKGEGRKRAVLYMVTPYMDHDLSGLLDNPEVRFTEPQIKCYMLQLLEGLRYLHDSHILHRDMKAANLLINNRGILQIADFGLARHYDEPVPQPGKGGGEARREYTSLVVTRWYRPPELLLSLKRYTTAIDMWGAGCVFGEMFKRKPILAGTSDLNQAQIIFDLVGSPTDENMPGWRELPGCEQVKNFEYRRGNLAQVFREQGSSAISLLQELLKLDWRKRINAIDALKHPYFRMDPLPARPEDLPRYSDSHELDRRTARGQKAALPPAPAGGTVGMGPDQQWTGSGPPANGAGPWVNGDGRPPRAWQDRGPPGTGPPPPGGMRGGYDNRIPYAAYDARGAPPPPPRRQPWAGDGVSQGHGRGLPPPPGDGSRHPLPPAPHVPPPAYRERPGGNAPPVNRGNVDTYIPSYSDGGAGGRRGSGDRDARPGFRPDERGRVPGRRDERFDRDRERERGGPQGRALDYGGGGGRERDRRSTRSRSPIDADRRRDRERDGYRR